MMDAVGYFSQEQSKFGVTILSNAQGENRQICLNGLVVYYSGRHNPDQTELK